MSGLSLAFPYAWGGSCLPLASLFVGGGMSRLYDPCHDHPLDGLDGLLINGRDPRARQRRAVQVVQAAHRQREDRRMRGALSREGYRRWRWPLIEDKCPDGLSEQVAAEKGSDLAELVDAPAWHALGY